VFAVQVICQRRRLRRGKWCLTVLLDIVKSGMGRGQVDYLEGWYLWSKEKRNRARQAQGVGGVGGFLAGPSGELIKAFIERWRAELAENGTHDVRLVLVWVRY
jgi:hypothetical protein